jgi:DNA primase
MLALVSGRTELRRAGVNSYFGICPFHDERTGSFHVRPDEKHYHCFGCQESGDPFDFVMQTEGLDFKHAMESLADRFGVPLETEDEDPEAAASRQRRERLHTLLDRTATYYSRYLWEAREADDARAYLLGRGLEEQTLREFRVGYAPSAWDRILLASRRSGYTDDELLTVGLAQRSKTRPGSIFDRFRERIMFPAVDARGRVHGFGARRMRENQTGAGGAKYLNTSEGELYHKREVLFGIDLARAAAARAGRMILVEGYTDVLALHQAGIRNAVGIMGTSLTEEQVNELERVVKLLELCLDSDRAGQDAMLRAAKLTATRKVELRVIGLPQGSDPADIVAAEGVDALRTLIRASVPFVAFNVDHILDHADTGTAEGRDHALGQLGPMLAELGGSVLHDELLRRIASRLQLSSAQAAQLASTAAGPRLTSTAQGRSNGSAPPSGATTSPAVRAERSFLALCLAVPDIGATTLRQIDATALLTSGVLRRAAGHLAGHVAAPMAELPPDDDELARTVSGLVALAGRVLDASPDRLAHARLVLELARLDRAIVGARGDGAGGNELAREREVVREDMRAVTARLEDTL